MTIKVNSKERVSESIEGLGIKSQLSPVSEKHDKQTNANDVAEYLKTKCQD